MNQEHPSVGNMWSEYLKTQGEDPEDTKLEYTSWHFENNKKDANLLVELVICGQKRATASSLWVCQYDGEPIPAAGDYSIVTDWDGIARCIIKTTEVDIVPFKDVSADFAAIEGEGDSSLEYWRQTHENYFHQELERIGKDLSEEMPVICEQFKVVYQ